nr:Aha5 [Streptomyces tasikensis]
MSWPGTKPWPGRGTDGDPGLGGCRPAHPHPRARGSVRGAWSGAGGPYGERVVWAGGLCGGCLVRGRWPMQWMSGQRPAAHAVGARSRAGGPRGGHVVRGRWPVRWMSGQGPVADAVGVWSEAGGHEAGARSRAGGLCGGCLVRGQWP